MIYSIFVLLSGIAIGQEYSTIIPSIKILAINLFEYLKQHAIEKKVVENNSTHFISNYLYKLFYNT